MVYLLGFIGVSVTSLVCVGSVWAEENYSELVYPGEEGKLVYTPDEKGNVIHDFSHCGYMGGGVALPDMPVVMTVEPQAERDDTERLQAAIDKVAKRLARSVDVGTVAVDEIHRHVQGVLGVTLEPHAVLEHKGQCAATIVVGIGPHLAAVAEIAVGLALGEGRVG